MRTISVRVTAGAKKEKVEELANGRLAIAVKEKPEQGKANERVLELVAAHLKVPRKKVSITRGSKSPSKIITVR